MKLWIVDLVAVFIITRESDGHDGHLHCSRDCRRCHFNIMSLRIDCCTGSRFRWRTRRLSDELLPVELTKVRQSFVVRNLIELLVELPDGSEIGRY